MHRKIAYVFFAIIVCVIISGCRAGDVASNHAETEVAAVTQTETGETVTECVANEQQDFEESLYEYTVELDEIPELRYRNISNLEYRLRNYICHNDTLILGTTIYKKEGETYVRQELTLNAIFDRDEDLGMQCAQYQNLAITVSQDNASFFIYDMDTQEKYCYYSVGEDVMISPFWYIYDGCIYYSEWARWDKPEQKRTLKKLSLSDGSITELYQPVIVESGDCVLREVRTRNDAAMSYEICDKTTGHREYWIAQADENGKWSGKKLWETDKWEFSYTLDFNQYGLIILGELSTPCDYEIVAIKDNGETKLLDNNLVYGEYLFTDDGYFCSNLAELENAVWDTDDVESELLSRRLADGVSFYDYEGNQKGFYPMGNKALLERGYYLTKLTYNEGQLTGFYVQRDTDELYISQITLEGNNNMAEYETIREFFQNDYMDIEAHAKYQDGEEWVEATVFAEWYLVKRYDKGSVYRLKVQPLAELMPDRLNTYFYVTDHEIYRIFGWAWQDEESITFYDDDELLMQILDTDEKLKNNGYIVCQDQNISGQLEHGETGWYTIYQEQAEQGNDSVTWHFNVHKWKNEIVCDSRIIRVNGERDYYETFVWENGKGLTEFCSGYRVERDILYLTEISETVVEG